ncbi:putative tyrosinase-like protein tyr-3 [Saccostrea echinata]|uniref:putative tyrosinase-like protein tyr-3 n=1 Tax=Saccostrea echinata TaxID=191078 RepID=UPI002A7F0C19|nr:putative tyrosinase-like protein tyr-3 [Saccostrea echinata]
MEIATQILGQGVFINPVNINGSVKVEFVEFEQPLDFDIHDESMFATSDPRFEFPLTEADVTWLNSLFTLPEQGETRVRKEYRLLTEEERNNFHTAINMLKNDSTVSLNKYDLLANIHSRSSSNTAAHGGPGFLGWHRVFLLLFENALRQKIRTVTLPYWDCTLDQPLPHPSQSVIWSHLFLGNGNGQVKTGPFRNWDTQFGFGLLHRQVSSLRHLMSANDLKNILEEEYLGNISYPDTKSSKNLEQLHNNVHVWVGGLMRKIEIGAFDPVFYVLHSFVDKVWEDFRIHQRSKGIDPTKDYPEFYGRRNHAPFAPMGLGNIMVIDGISNIWNENIMHLQPSCGNNSTNACGSKFLKCGLSIERCVSKTIDEMLEYKDIDKIKDSVEAKPETKFISSSTFKSNNLYRQTFLQSNHLSQIYDNFSLYNDGNQMDLYSDTLYLHLFPDIEHSAIQKAKEIYTQHLKST